MSLPLNPHSSQPREVEPTRCQFQLGWPRTLYGYCTTVMKQLLTTNSLAADATGPPTQDKRCDMSGRSKS